MAQILVTPSEVIQGGDDIKRKKQEIEDTIQKGNALMNNLKGGFKGNLASQIFSKWDELQPRLKQSYQCLEEAGQVLRKAGDAFQQVDEMKI